MDPNSRAQRDPMSGAQQTSGQPGGPGTGGQWDNPTSRGQGQWENRQGKFVRNFFGAFPSCGPSRTGTSLVLALNYNESYFPLSVDDSGLSGGDTYAQQGRYDRGQDDSGQQQRSDNWGQGGAGVGATSDRYDTSGQYGGQQQFGSDQTSGGTDPTDDSLTGAGGGGKPSGTGKLMGTSLLGSWSCGVG
jgi:hypothetical protein